MPQTVCAQTPYVWQPLYAYPICYHAIGVYTVQNIHTHYICMSHVYYTMQRLLVNALVHLSSLFGSVGGCWLCHVCITAGCDKMSIYAQPLQVMEHVQLAKGHSNAAC